jgi:hypothetical protein
MGRALTPPGVSPTLQAHPKLSVRKGAYTYTVETVGDKSTYSVTDGTRTISVPIRWSFGAGAQTWMLERDGHFYESLVSYYPAINGLDTTMGDQVVTPHSLEEAMGRQLAPTEAHACFGCHATNAASPSDNTLTLDSLKPGLDCEHCHTGSSAHLVDALQGDYSSTPPNLKKLATEDVSSFCGQCHRTWDFVVRSPWRRETSVRFQPYRLANSRCFDGTDPRISCLACHDPHQDIVRDDATYDGKCLACHAASGKPVATQASGAKPATGKACPVATANCVSCHMPKTKLPGGPMTFTDHQIRIVKPGEPFPN